MKKYILYTIAIISILFLIKCEKDENPELLKTVFTNKVPKLATMPLSEITDTSALSGGIINNDGGSKIIANGVCWSISANPTINDNKTVDSIGNKNFTSKLTNLKAFTLYHIRSYATNNTGTAYGNTLLLKTSSNIPQINTQSISQITDSSVICGGDISSDGGAEINARGVCWSTSQNPTINNSKTLDSIGIGSFISNPIGLNAITTYYLRAYATNGVGTAYGEEKTFTTITAIPKLTTDSTKSITSTSAISGGYIKSTGGLPITAKGVCWSTSPNPTIADNKTENGTGPTAFTSNIIGLAPNVSYYVRAYATNSLGTAYGNQFSFITSTTLPVLTTNTITTITDSSAISGGNITTDGGLNITVRGVCWSTTQNPTIIDNRTIDGSGIGNFTSTLFGLLPGTTYYLRAYATNSAGTAYGNEVNFITLNIPSLTTSIITIITSNSAFSGGVVLSDGGAVVISRGVCWSTSPNPIITDNHTTDSTGIGNFTSNITGLTAGTTYYVRAYSKNSIGIAYGNEIMFITSFEIGQNYQGGIVFYVDNTGQHGLIASTVGGSSNLPNAITACSNLVISGISGWFLPSKEILNIMYTHRTILGMGTAKYWSSTILNNSNDIYWIHRFLTGLQDTDYMLSINSYRAVRGF